MRVRVLIAALCAAAAWPPGLSAADRRVDLKGRVVDRALKEGVPGARALIEGTSAGATADSAGRFRIEGIVSVRPTPARPRAPRFSGGFLWIETGDPIPVRIELFGTGGKCLSSSARMLAPGTNRIDAFTAAPREFAGFARVSMRGETWVMRALRVPGPAPLDWMGPAGPLPAALAKPAGEGGGGILEVTAGGLLPAQVPFGADSLDLGDIVLDYPERTIGVGAAPVYGAIVLFDGSRGRAAAEAELQAKWRDWPRFTPSDIRFRIVRDPGYPGDTDRVALQSCCNALWGYDDIQARIGLFRDCQIHVEWIGMGEYDEPFDSPDPNPNASDPAGQGQKGYINSGVYAASRYEVQIFSWDTSAAKVPGLHDMAAIVDDYAPSANRNRPNGVWQAYDITFRGARFDGTAMTSPPYMSVWWNGALVHDNRKLTGAAAGLANHSGEEHADTALYGLKLQSEGRDVRFRNVWIKQLDLEEARTRVGY